VIYDCILYGGERDILEARVEHLRGRVRKHVVVEGTRTFTGKPRPVEQPDLPGCFPWVVELDGETVRTAWQREHRQRAEALAGLRAAGAKSGDWVLLADTDEFPDLSLMDKPVFATMDLLSVIYYLNGLQLKHDGKDGEWEYGLFSVLAPFDVVERMGTQRLRDERFRVNEFGGAFQRRAGWHFTYQGGPDAVRKKLLAFSHQELNRPEVMEAGVLETRMDFGLWLDQPLDAAPSIHYVDLETFAPPAIVALAARQPERVHPVRSLA
jgi:beta-1,4-mannosyl-glycoprotein beta-1,4-N-acetylglucosaminyltransferase